MLRVPAAGVSRYHGVIQRAASGSWLVRDLGSTNGIKVNGVKIAGEKELVEGDSVEFGDQKIQVSGLGETAPPLVFNLLDAGAAGPSAGRPPDCRRSRRLRRRVKRRSRT